MSLLLWALSLLPLNRDFLGGKVWRSWSTIGHPWFSLADRRLRTRHRVNGVGLGCAWVSGTCGNVGGRGAGAREGFGIKVESGEILDVQ